MRSDDCCIARCVVGWWKHSIVYHMAEAHGMLLPVLLDLPPTVPRKAVQRKLFMHLSRMCRRPGRSVLEVLKARVDKWLLEVPPEAMPRMLLRLQHVSRATSPYLPVNQVRIACRGLCTSSRFRS